MLPSRYSATWVQMSNPATPASLRRRAPVPLDRCGLALAADLIGDRWSVLILRELLYGVARHADILADTGVSRTVLADRLDRLIAAGLVERFSYQEEASRLRSAYRLSITGKTLTLPLLGMAQWYDEHVRSDHPPLRLIDKRNGQLARLVFVNEAGIQVSSSDIGVAISSAQ